MATLITINGEIKDITPKNKKDGFTLEELYGHIGNGCDMVEVASGSLMITTRRDAWCW